MLPCLLIVTSERRGQPGYASSTTSMIVPWENKSAAGVQNVSKHSMLGPAEEYRSTSNGKVPRNELSATTASPSKKAVGTCCFEEFKSV